jgi:hypothetical protein
MNERVRKWSVVATVFLVATAHLWRIERQSLWGDEAASWVKTSALDFHTTFSIIKHSTDTDRLTGFYLATLWGWRQVVGDSTTALRSFSLLMLWGAMLFGWLLWRERGQPAVGKWFVLLLGINPFWFYQSHEMRSYTMALAIVMACLWLQQMRLGHNITFSRFCFADFGTPFILGLAAITNFYAILLAPVMFIHDAFNYRRLGLKRILVTQSLVAIIGALLTWNYLAASQGSPPASGYTRPFSWLQLLGLVHGSLLGVSWGASLLEIRSGSSLAWTLLAYWPWYTVSVAAIFLSFSQLRDLGTRPWLHAEVWLSILSFAAVAWLSFRHSYPAAPRHLLLLAPGLFGLLALAAHRCPASVAPIVLCFVTSSVLYLTDAKYSREGWNESLAVAHDHVSPRGTSMVHTQSDVFIFDVYLPFQSAPWNRILLTERSRTRYQTDPKPPLFLHRLADWKEPQLPDLLLVARIWELPRPDQERLNRMTAKMRILHESPGIFLYRRSFTSLPP